MWSAKAISGARKSRVWAFCFREILKFGPPGFATFLSFESKASSLSSVSSSRATSRKRGAVAVTEIEFRQTTVEVLFAHVMEGADDAALQQAEVALNRVALGVTANVLVLAVVNRLMAGKLTAGDFRSACIPACGFDPPGSARSMG